MDDTSNAQRSRRASPSSPRFQGNRVSRSISFGQAKNLVAGAVHAGVIGSPLNRFITIHWEAGGVADGPGPTTRFMKLAGDWLALNATPRVSLWVRETGDGRGEHVHILIHVPPRLIRGFAARQRGWLKACGVIYRADVVHTRPVGFSYTVVQHGPKFADWYLSELTKAVEYILKGAEVSTAKAMGLNRPRDFEGHVTGKRAATSERIGAAARDRWSKQNPDRPAPNGSRIEQIAAMVHPG